MCSASDKCPVCPRSLDTFYIVRYYIEWIKPSWGIIYMIYKLINIFIISENHI